MFVFSGVSTPVGLVNARLGSTMAAKGNYVVTGGPTSGGLGMSCLVLSYCFCLHACLLVRTYKLWMFYFVFLFIFSVSNSGSAAIYQKIKNTWRLVLEIKAAPIKHAYYGTAVGISSSYAAISRPCSASEFSLLTFCLCLPTCVTHRIFRW